MINGTTGKILWVNLTTSTWKTREIPDETYKMFLSGSGLAAHILYHSIPPAADPLGPENVLGFVSGLLTATGTFFSGRWMAVSKSPLTNTWGEANCGGDFSPAIKRSGFDGIFFEGISPHPVYLFIDKDTIELRNATHLWGKDSFETQNKLQEETAKKCSIACIGQAGENISLISGICNAGERMAARSGLGAVMGSKRLKAVVLVGNNKIPAHDPATIKNLNKKVTRVIKFKIPLPEGRFIKYLGSLLRLLPLQVSQDGILYKLFLQRWGTIGMNQVSIEMGDTPIRNWGGNSSTFGFKSSDKINPDLITRFEKKKYACYACPLGCGGLLELPGESDLHHKPEYETVLAWTGLLLNDDLASIYAINNILNRAGMDSISAGGTVAFAIECYEKGILTKEDTGGLELSWGNRESIFKLLDMMINRKGIGDILADGSKTAAAKIGKGSANYAMHSGGQELAMHDTRNDPGFALHAGVEATPGRHVYGSYLYYEMFKLWTKVKYLPSPRPIYFKNSKYKNPVEKAIWAAACSRFMQVVNGSGICLFGVLIGVNRIPVFEWLNAVTGWNFTPDEYMLIGERIQTVKQLFNARQGAALKHELNPRLLGIPKQESGANQGKSVDLDSLVMAYWNNFHWDEKTGIPTKASLEYLGLSDMEVEQ